MLGNSRARAWGLTSRVASSCCSALLRTGIAENRKVIDLDQVLGEDRTSTGQPQGEEGRQDTSMHGLGSLEEGIRVSEGGIPTRYTHRLAAL